MKWISFTKKCDFYGLQKGKKDSDRRFRFDIKEDVRLERKLRDPLNMKICPG